jgi:tRNA-dihydrouridine synthase B
LIRSSEKTHKKLQLTVDEHPVGIQIYGGHKDSMIFAARTAQEQNPELIDINAGCWVRKVVGGGAGAALVKDPVYLQELTSAVVKSVNLPVTLKTRIGWDSATINIVEIAKRVEDAGAQAITIHCRTRAQGHSGEPSWEWIAKAKTAVAIPVILNGGIMTADDILKAYRETPADALMIARGAIGNPWIFSQGKDALAGREIAPVTPELRIRTCLKHLALAMFIKGERRAVIEHRKFYSGYLKGLRSAAFIRGRMMTFDSFSAVEDELMQYLRLIEAGEPIPKEIT